MILSDKEILRRIDKGEIVITPFDRACLGSNSYDVHLSEHIAVYNHNIDNPNAVLDSKVEPKLSHYKIPKDGLVLHPGTLYLGSTVEYTETHNAVPFLEGKSSTGRLGISIHATAGKGDAGFCNHWTLEISVVEPVKIYAGMPIGQLIYFAILGDVETLYKDKASAKYTSIDPRPVGSMMYKNFLCNEGNNSPK